MAKAPGGTLKGKAAAPAQFDMNSRDRKPGGGGKGRPGGPGGAGGRGRDEKRAPSRIVTLPPAIVDRGAGWVIQKIGKIEQTTKTAMGAEYQLIFDGHDPLSFDYLGAARDRAKEAPPEKEQAAKEPVEEEQALEEPTEDVEAAPAAEEV